MSLNLGAMPDGGQLTIAARITTPPPDRPSPNVIMAVTDNGSSMSPHVGNRAVDPSFTTKATGTGTGLGLATAEPSPKQAATIHIDTTRATTP